MHPGAIKTELGRHSDETRIAALIASINAQLASEGKPPFEYKTVPQGAATSVWAAVVANGADVGGRYCENCHVGEVVTPERAISAVSEGVRAYALDPETARALWSKSEEMVGERF